MRGSHRPLRLTDGPQGGPAASPLRIDDEVRDGIDYEHTRL
ncbi:hypothetical protein [Halalkalicoccus salilacus]